MRVPSLASLAVAASSAPLLAAVLVVACGGKTPPPVADNAPAATDAPAASSPPAASSASEASPPVASAAPSASGRPTDLSDIKPGSGGDDPWLASHQMPPKDVIATMRAANAKVQACWRAGLKRDPSTTGEVKIRFVITNDGAVRAWRDDASSMTDGDVTQCVGEVVNKLRFPKQKSPGDAWGLYSINFAP